MKCYNCGCTLSENDFCTACGAEVATYKKIIRLSNMYYNDGLKKAKVRDLSGAVQSLRQSLKCNKNNIDARNLLGLVYFEMGEAVSALSEWVISKNLRNKKNVADDFIQEIQSNPTKLDAINQTIKKYNQALVYCKQGSLDLAVIQLKKVLSINPNLIKGYQLLTLLYINNEEWEKAKKTIAKAEKVDANNTTTLYYAREIERALKLKEEASPDHKKKKQRDGVVKYQSGNETIIQPTYYQEKNGASTVINLIIGVVIGLAIMWFLVLPARIQSEKSDINKNLVEVSNQLTEKSATMDEMQKRIDALQGENSNLQGQVQNLTGNDGVLTANDALMKAAEMYMENPDNVTEIAAVLEAIDPSYVSQNEVSDSFRLLYQKIHGDVSAKASAKLLDSGLAALKKNDFDSAISDLTGSFEADQTNVEALYNLGHAYRKAEKTDQAEETYQKVIDLFPDSDYAKNAQQYVSNGAKGTQTEQPANTQEVPAAPPVVQPDPTVNAVDPTLPADQNALGAVAQDGTVTDQ